MLCVAVMLPATLSTTSRWMQLYLRGVGVRMASVFELCGEKLFVFYGRLNCAVSLGWDERPFRIRAFGEERPP